MRYFLHIAYQGTKYRGWQRQTNVISVQQVIEEKLKDIFKETVVVYGCGRTDAGVHASQYILHINLEKPLEFDLLFRMNKHLPDDILVFDVIPVQNDQHARYDANFRTYDYFIHLNLDPFLHPISSYYEVEKLDTVKMKEAVALLTKYDNYWSFCKTPEAHNHTLCTVSKAQLLVSKDGKRLQLNITANRFLKSMIRLIVENLMNIGTGEVSFSNFEKALKEQADTVSRKPAPSNGLYLSKIEYPYLSLPSKASVVQLLNKDLS